MGRRWASWVCGLAAVGCAASHELGAEPPRGRDLVCPAAANPDGVVAYGLRAQGEAADGTVRRLTVVAVLADGSRMALPGLDRDGAPFEVAGTAAGGGTVAVTVGGAGPEARRSVHVWTPGASGWVTAISGLAPIRAQAVSSGGGIVWIRGDLLREGYLYEVPSATLSPLPAGVEPLESAFGFVDGWTPGTRREPSTLGETPIYVSPTGRVMALPNEIADRVRTLGARRGRWVVLFEPSPAEPRQAGTLGPDGTLALTPLPFRSDEHLEWFSDPNATVFKRPGEREAVVFSVPGRLVAPLPPWPDGHVRVDLASVGDWFLMSVLGLPVHRIHLPTGAATDPGASLAEDVVLLDGLPAPPALASDGRVGVVLHARAESGLYVSEGRGGRFALRGRPLHDVQAARVVAIGEAWVVWAGEGIASRTLDWSHPPLPEAVIGPHMQLVPADPAAPAVVFPRTAGRLDPNPTATCARFQGGTDGPGIVDLETGARRTLDDLRHLWWAREQ